MQQLRRGERLAEMLKQPLHATMSVDRQVCIMWAAVNGAMDDVPLNDVARFQAEWFQLLGNAYPDIGRTIVETGELTDELVERLEASMVQFKTIFISTGKAESISPTRIVPRVADQESRRPEVAVRAGTEV